MIDTHAFTFLAEIASRGAAVVDVTHLRARVNPSSIAAAAWLAAADRRSEGILSLSTIDDDQRTQPAS